MAVAPQYCTDRDLKDVFPHIDDYDTKVPIYGWVVHDGSLYRADNCGLITQLFVDGQDLGDPEANSGVLNANGEWYYDSDLDAVYYYSASNPNDSLMESGEDWVTLKIRYRENASRYFESKIDKSLPRELFKDKGGSYDYVVIRTTALLTCSFLIRSFDPTSEFANAFWDEAMATIESLNSGDMKLGHQTTGDSSKGILRDVSYTSGSIRPVDTRGRYKGTWDLIRVLIDTGGVIGTAKYSVWVKDSDQLKNNKVIDAEIINGDYQSLAGGLQIRFAGDTDATTAASSDEWEVEVAGYTEEVDNPSSFRSVKLSRR